VVLGRIGVRRVRRLLLVPGVVLDVGSVCLGSELTARLFRPRTSPGIFCSIVLFTEFDVEEDCAKVKCISK
jgi:hypothetical protein